MKRVFSVRVFSGDLGCVSGAMRRRQARLPLKTEQRDTVMPADPLQTTHLRRCRFPAGTGKRCAPNARAGTRKEPRSMRSSVRLRFFHAVNGCVPTAAGGTLHTSAVLRSGPSAIRFNERCAGPTRVRRQRPRARQCCAPGQRALSKNAVQLAQELSHRIQCAVSKSSRRALMSPLRRRRLTFGGARCLRIRKEALSARRGSAGAGHGNSWTVCRIRILGMGVRRQGFGKPVGQQSSLPVLENGERCGYGCG